MFERFSWRSYDLRSLLPSTWREDIFRIATNAVPKNLFPRSVTSREENPNTPIPVLTLDGNSIYEQLPWLYNLYKGLFLDLGQIGLEEPLFTAQDNQHGININIQQGINMRYEAHVDYNPLQGLLYVTTHPQGTGGELVVANETSAHSVEEIEKNCSVVYPVSGNLVFFDARRFPHYVRPLTNSYAKRIVIAMSFYTPSCPENGRPSDLSEHLFGSESYPVHLVDPLFSGSHESSPRGLSQ